MWRQAVIHLNWQVCAVDKTSTPYNYRINHIVSHSEQRHTRKCARAHRIAFISCKMCAVFVQAFRCNSSNSVHCTGILVCNYRMIALILVFFSRIKQQCVWDSIEIEISIIKTLFMTRRSTSLECWISQSEWNAWTRGCVCAVKSPFNVTIFSMCQFTFQPFWKKSTFLDWLKYHKNNSIRNHSKQNE